MMKRRRLTAAVLGAGFLCLTALPPVRSGVAQAYEQIRLIVDVLQYVQTSYVTEPDTKSLVYGAAHGMIRTLDPFSQFMEPAQYKEMQTETKGEFGGLGIRLGIRDGWLVVITPIEDTPAYRLGVLPGDKIVKIEGENTQGMSLNDAVGKLRGKPKTKVTISLFREGDKEAKDYTITREVIEIKAVKARLLPEGIAHVRLAEFNEKCFGEIQKFLGDFSKQGMKSLVLDLRNDPGGLLNAAVDVSKLFISDGKLVVYTEGRASPRQEYYADARAPYADLPLVVLVNRGSASASEIVSGAVQDHKRGLLIGGETFGKGSVQSIIALEGSDGAALRLTTAKYYTPSGRSIHRDEKTGKGGITPDIVIDVPRETEVKLQAQAEEVVAKGKETVSPVKPEDRVRDEVLDRAVEILKAQAVFSKLGK
jgi:carboxyl-terminal processing protease